MLSQILAGQTRNFALLLGGVMVFLYLLPAIMAFVKAQHRFYAIVALNLPLALVQGFILVKLSPHLISVDTTPHALRTALLVDFGPGWLALLAWTFAPAAPDPRLVAARATKAFDAVAALPLVLWFAYGVLQLRVTLVFDFNLIASGKAPLFNYVRLFALVCAAAFDLLLIWTLLVRDRAVAKSQGVLPRVCGFVGTFLGVGIIQLPPAPLGLGLQILAALLIGLGNLGSILVLWRLGKSFSILPEARRLVTSGPYAHARHPLYSVEMITITGTALQFIQPWASLIALAVGALLVIRSVYEERVLGAAFPDYAAYRARTARFIPGVIWRRPPI
jgi:protein-S-isoprenylcysteine O-methyltransferase Ste14